MNKQMILLKFQQIFLHTYFRAD